MLRELGILCLLSAAVCAAQVQVDAKMAAQPQVQVDAKIRAQPQVQVDAKMAAQPQVQVDAKIGAQPQVQVDAKMAAQPQVQVDVKTPVAFATNSSNALARINEQGPARRYDGHVILKVVPHSQQELDRLRSLFRSDEIDVWKAVTLVGEEVHFRVSPEAYRWTVGYLDDEGIKYEVLLSDVQRLIDGQQVPQAPFLRDADTFGWDAFHRLDVIYEWMKSMTLRFPAVATLVKGGLSSEGRQILGVRIAHADNLPVVYVEGGIHGREWISPAAATFILDHLLTSEDPAVQKVARSFEWHVFPSVNPDAYEYSHTTDRLWRKSRKRNSFLCYGVDLNRNFPQHWGTVGVSWNLCSETYPGTRAASELETRSRIAYLEPLLPRVKAFVALHSYGQFLLFPYGSSTERASNYDALLDVGTKAAESFAKRHGTRLQVGSISETLYPASGAAGDWAHSRGVPYSFTLELRPSTRAPFVGFILPADQIVPAAEEALDGVVAMVTAILGKTR